MNSKYMNLAFHYANMAYELDEVPIGCVIVKNNEVISFGYNQKESTNCSINHAEILAIKDAQSKLNNWRLLDCDLYVTLDPCPMCASAIKQSRIRNVYSALENSDSNNTSLIQAIFKADYVNPSVNFISNLDVSASQDLLKKFFHNKREI